MDNSYRISSGIQETEQHCRLLNEWSLSYDQLSSGRFQSSLVEMWLDDIQIYKEQICQSVFQQGDSRSNTFCFGVFGYLSEEARWLGEPVTTGHISWIPVDGETMLKTPQFSSFYVISIPLDIVGDLLCELPDNSYLLRHDNLAASIRTQIGYILQGALDHPLDVMTKRARKHFISDIRGLVDQFATAVEEAGCQHRKNQWRYLSKARAVVNQATEAVTENRQLPLSVDDLCQLTYTSRRTLQNCFVTVTGQSPAAFLKNIRLNRVKKSLAKHENNGSVSDIACDWGFWHLSQFTKDYKNLFGELPSETLRANMLKPGGHYFF